MGMSISFRTPLQPFAFTAFTAQHHGVTYKYQIRICVRYSIRRVTTSSPSTCEINFVYWDSQNLIRYRSQVRFMPPTRQSEEPKSLSMTGSLDQIIWHKTFEEYCEVIDNIKELNIKISLKPQMLFETSFNRSVTWIYCILGLVMIFHLMEKCFHYFFVGRVYAFILFYFYMLCIMVKVIIMDCVILVRCLCHISLIIFLVEFYFVVVFISVMDMMHVCLAKECKRKWEKQKQWKSSHFTKKYWGLERKKTTFAMHDHK